MNTNMTMKPTWWKDAPEWARYAAMDSDGKWWWYENDPNLVDGSGHFDSVGKKAEAETLRSVWQDSKQQRPQPKQAAT